MRTHPPKYTKVKNTTQTPEIEIKSRLMTLTVSHHQKHISIEHLHRIEQWRFRHSFLQVTVSHELTLSKSHAEFLDTAHKHTPDY